VARDSLGRLAEVADTLIVVVLVLLLSTYLTADGSQIASRLRQEAPQAQRHRAIFLIAVVACVVGGIASSASSTLSRTSRSPRWSEPRPHRP
jgi:predicted PurR-regulated permease PerM